MGAVSDRTQSWLDLLAFGCDSFLLNVYFA